MVAGARGGACRASGGADSVRLVLHRLVLRLLALRGPVLGGQFGDRFGQFGAFGYVLEPEIVGQTGEGGATPRSDVFWLHTEHSRDDLVLHVAAQGQVQKRTVLWIRVPERPPNFSIPG